MDDETPPVRRLGLKQREVIPSDTVSRPGDGTAISVPLMIQENKLAEARLARDGRGIAPAPAADLPPKFERTDPPASTGGEEAITVDDILRQNQSAARASASELIAMPVRRRSRRSWDFALILGTAATAGGVLIFVFRRDLQVVALVLAAIVLITLVFSWILFGVMDKY